MIHSVQLNPAEALLLKIEQERHEQVVRSSTEKLEQALKAIYHAHGWEWGKTKGQMQKDPLDQNIIRFVYDDGINADAEKPKLQIVDIAPVPDQDRQVPA